MNDGPNWSDPADPGWTTFAKIMRLGGAWDGHRETLWFPYLFATFPGDRHDVFSHACVIGKDVNLRAEPSRSSRVCGRLSYDIVQILADHGEWFRVLTPEARIGYVHRDYIYSPIGIRAGFQLIGGHWRLMYFLSGD